MQRYGFGVLADFRNHDLVGMQSAWTDAARCLLAWHDAVVLSEP